MKGMYHHTGQFLHFQGSFSSPLRKLESAVQLLMLIYKRSVKIRACILLLCEYVHLQCGCELDFHVKVRRQLAGVGSFLCGSSGLNSNPHTFQHVSLLTHHGTWNFQLLLMLHLGGDNGRTVEEFKVIFSQHIMFKFSKIKSNLSFKVGYKIVAKHSLENTLFKKNS